ncbi:NUMOD4 motif [Lysinibacillus sphaericus]|nr:NUMOD4 motif [Lysinibacillus sphaericus]
MTEEKRKEIEEYKGLYEITESGRIYSLYRKRFLARCNDEYGFHIVKLSKNGKPKNHIVFDLWEIAFPHLPKSDFKGAKERIY